MRAIENLNYKEEKAIKELKIRIENDLTPSMREDPTIYYRFLKARDFDIDKAEKFLRKNIIWRKTQQVDSILQNFKPSEFFVKYTEPSWIGYDKDNDPVLYHPTGTLNVNEVYKSVKMNDFIRHFIWLAEKTIEKGLDHNRKIGNNSYQASVIVNLDQVTIANVTSKLTIDLFLRFVHIYQDNYPERLKYLYVINAPSYFMYVFTVLKTVMSAVSINKFRIFDRNGWVENLLDLIDAEVLPAFLGGNRTDPDGNPFCRSFVTSAGKISEKYFLTDKDRYFENNTQVRKISISNQKKNEIIVHIPEANSVLEWEFLVRGKDIGFGLFFQNSKMDKEEIIPIERYDTSDGTEKYSYKCHMAGTYIIVFDNTYSWLNSKVVEYSINIIEGKAKYTF